jgi:hypothetical protein
MSSKDLAPYKAAVIETLGRKALEDDAIDMFGRAQFKRRWGGVHSEDEVGHNLVPNRYHIVNTSRHNGPGVHWTGLYVSRAGRAYVYDSFARPIAKLLPHEVRKMRGEGHAVEEAHAHANQRSGELCGQLSLAWLLLVRDHGIRAALEGPIDVVPGT